MSKNIFISIPSSLFEFLSERSEISGLSISEIIVRAVDQHFYEYEDNYPWYQVKKEIDNV